ncbi:MAG: CAP domain-containing protein [Polyangiales bacterium]
MRRALWFLLATCGGVACSAADGGDISGDDGGTVDDDSGTPVDDGGTPIDDGGGTTDSSSSGTDTGSGGTKDTGTVTMDTKPPPVVPGAVYGAKCADMTADDTLAWQDIAIVRGKAKMGALDCNDAIQKAGRAHASYIVLNGGKLTHTETSGNPGFTGVNFWDRMSAAGFSGPGSAMFEVVHSLGDGHGSILGSDGWINTLYHRIPFVSFGAKGYGFGNNSGKFATIDFSSGGSAPSKSAISTWPADGDTAVYTTFRCASEIPNPIPGATYAGYPVSLTGGSALNVSTHTMSTGGAAVDHVFITKATDGAGLVPDSQVYLIAKTPLNPSTKYDVHVAGTVGGASFDSSFSFTTGTK